MRKFVAKHAALTTGTLSCFDRLLFKGHLSFGYPHGMEDFLNYQGVLFKQLKPFVLRQAERLRTHSHTLAEKAGRPWQYFESPVRKDERAREIASRDGITEGLVCVFATVEPCRSFRLAYGQGRPAIRPAWRKCLFLYFYFLDRQFGLLHVRLQTWFPFAIQVYLNGHDWLAASWTSEASATGASTTPSSGSRIPGGPSAYLPRYAAVSATANHRYLDALAVVDDPAPAHRALDCLVQPVRDGQGSASRPFNPAASSDLRLFAAVLRGEHLLQGLRNRELRLRLFGPSAVSDRRRSAHVSRLLKRLHLRGLLAKIPRSRRWRVTQLGHAVMTTAVLLREEDFPNSFLQDAA